jgi:Rad3-related DNA helicase
VLEDAVERVARHLAEGGRERYQAIVDLIERSPPRLVGWSGGSLVRSGEKLIEAATRRALALDRSMLFIQGPPGTGKTYASAHVIVALMRAGKRVGVSSNSHKAINNLLAKVEDIAAEQGLRFSGAKKVPTDPDSYLKGTVIEDITGNGEIEDGDFDLVGGTAWLFAREALDQRFDYLFIDEAGQVSLGHLVAMASAARNLSWSATRCNWASRSRARIPGTAGCRCSTTCSRARRRSRPSAASCWTSAGGCTRTSSSSSPPPSTTAG